MPDYIPLVPEFYRRPVLMVARSLLGKYFIRHYGNERLVGKIVETEAYHEIGDPSCHAHRGKTRRNEAMFGRGGLLYVYFTYGMYYCMNVVAEEEGVAAAVLIRALEPVEGINTMEALRNQNRKNPPKGNLKPGDIASGPAKLCQAFSISTEQNGISLIKMGEMGLGNSPTQTKINSIYIGEKQPSNAGLSEQDIVTTTRIGISSGTDLPWRFYIKDNAFVSKTSPFKS